MPIDLNSQCEGRLLTVHLTGKLRADDYKKFVPAVEKAVKQHGKVRMLVEMDEFHGWSVGALWQDIKFDARHFNHIERLALLGNKRWERWMAKFCRPFTTAKVRYFPLARSDDAKQWLAPGK